MEDNYMDYSIAVIEGKTIYEHEVIYTIMTKKPIPKGFIVMHIDNNIDNNQTTNLYATRQLNIDKDIDKDNVFHEDNIEKNIPFIKKHFPQVYEALDLENYYKGKYKTVIQNPEEFIRTNKNHFENYMKKHSNVNIN